MFDESGSEYRPRPVPKPTPAPAAKPTPPPVTPSVQQPGRRPLWLRLALNFLLFLFFFRVVQVCAISGDDPIALFAHFALTLVMAIFLLGLLGNRRWGVWLFLLYCAWNMLSAVVVGVYRIAVMEEAVVNAANVSWLAMSEILSMGMIVAFYGLFGLVFWAKRDLFQPSQNPMNWSSVTYTVIVSIMILVTATQIDAARQYIRLTEEELEDNRIWIDDRF